MHKVRLLLLILTCTPACQDSPYGQESADSRGFRVVSLHPTATEIIAGIGAAQDLVAATGSSGLSEFARRATHDTPQLAAGPVSVEGLVALRATHVFGTESSLEEQPTLQHSLQQLGIESHFLDPGSLAELWFVIEQCGRVLNRVDAAQVWTSGLQDQVARLETLDTPSGEAVRVFFYDCCDPPFTAGGRVPLNELLAPLGARNIFDDLDQDWSPVSWEAVIARDPELIIVHEYEFKGQKAASAKIEHLQSMGFAQEITAIRNGSFAVIPLALVLEGPRTLEAIARLQEPLKKARSLRQSAKAEGEAR